MAGIRWWNVPLPVQFPTQPVQLAGIGIRIDELARRCGLTLHDWDGDGLGPARGCVLRLPSGRLFVLEELGLLVQYRGAPGPLVLVDATELAAVGAEPLVEELMAAMKLSRTDFPEVVGPKEQWEAAEMAAMVLTKKPPSE